MVGLLGSKGWDWIIRYIKYRSDVWVMENWSDQMVYVFDPILGWLQLPISPLWPCFAFVHLRLINSSNPTWSPRHVEMWSILVLPSFCNIAPSIPLSFFLGLYNPPPETFSPFHLTLTEVSEGVCGSYLRPWFPSKHPYLPFQPGLLSPKSRIYPRRGSGKILQPMSETQNPSSISSYSLRLHYLWSGKDALISRYTS